jgi:hypothetical protein
MRRAASPRASKPSLIRQGAVRPVVTDDDVIEDSNTDKLACLAQPPRQGEIFAGGRWITARMIVNEDHRRCVAEDRGLEHFPWVHEGRGERAEAHQIDPDRAILAVEEHYPE